MRFLDMIHKKRDGYALCADEIHHMVNSYVAGDIPDYQMSSMLMAIYFRGLSDDELVALTLAMRDSGDVVDLSGISGIKVDKHSTGGVGDKTTLIIGPIVASCGIPVAKMSGRGLGFTGGTIDKLESIPGYRVDISEREFYQAVEKNHISLIGQSKELAPADKLLYALRDVTATVESIPLIASSIMSKKLAAGSDKILLDVTTGNGAFIKDIEGSRELAKRMVSIGNKAGKETIAMITSMDEPLGYAIGNSLEVIEAVNTLRGEGPKDLQKICFALAGMMISMGSPTQNITYEQGIDMAKSAIADGSAYDKFLALMRTQGADISYIEDTDKLYSDRISGELIADKDGYIVSYDTEGFGIGAALLGAGRETKDDEIDYGAGIILHKKSGDSVRVGESIATLYTSDDKRLDNARTYLGNCYDIGDDKVTTPPLIREIIGK